MSDRVSADLLRLAHLYGVRTSWFDVFGEHRHTPPDSALAVLRALGAPVADAGDVPDAIRHRLEELTTRTCEPVTVAWQGRPAAAVVRFGPEEAGSRMRIELVPEEVRGDSGGCDPGASVHHGNGYSASSSHGTGRCLWEGRPEELRTLGTTRLGAREIRAVAFPLPAGLAPGYHRLNVEVGGEQAGSLVIAAPDRLIPPGAGSWTAAGAGSAAGAAEGFGAAEGSGASPGDAPSSRRWGVFLPLYALISKQSLGIGDLGDLERLLAWTAGLGGSFVGTLPLLAARHVGDGTPSPYAPASRLFFNEVYLDIGRLPELERCAAARELMASTAFRDELEKLRADEAPQQGEVMALKRRLLELLSDCFFADGPPEDFAGFLAGVGTGGGWGTGAGIGAEDKEAAGKRAAAGAGKEVGAEQGTSILEAYARFMAAGETDGRPWPEWPAGAAGGVIDEASYDPRACRYHQYVQYRLAGQLAGLAGRAAEAGTALYLDYPVGVPPDSFDAWYFRSLFAAGVAVGAPPDTFFRKGQNWRFPPLVPERERATGYRYFRAALQAHLRYAPLLRFDHIMGLSRLFWIPDGYPATAGAYVHDRPDERLAILLLEASRAGAEIVGEDLGTVPRSVRARMQRHGLYRMYIVQSELRPDPAEALPEPGPEYLTALNTHDMPLFAAFWNDEDTALLARLDHLDEATAGGIDRERAAARSALERWLGSAGLLTSAASSDSGSLEAIMRACHRYLARSPARLFMVTLEDLWGERRPQNVPGTGRELPNWLRRSRYALEEFTTRADIHAMLGEIDALRREGPAKSP